MSVSWKVFSCEGKSVFLWEAAPGRKKKKVTISPRKTELTSFFKVLPCNWHSEKVWGIWVKNTPKTHKKSSALSIKKTLAKLQLYDVIPSTQGLGTQRHPNIPSIALSMQPRSQSPFTNYNLGFTNPAKMLQNILQTKVCCIRFSLLENFTATFFDVQVPLSFSLKKTQTSNNIWGGKKGK